MAQPRKHVFALTAVIQRILPEGFRERITRRCRYRRDAKVGLKSLAVTRSALLPLGWGIVRLGNASSDCSADDGIGAERIEEVVAELRFLGRTGVRQSQLRLRCAW